MSGIVGRTQEIAELTNFLQDEIGSLATTEHPIVHWFLIEGIATKLARRSLAVSQEATMVLCEVEQRKRQTIEQEGETA